MKIIAAIITFSLVIACDRESAFKADEWREYREIYTIVADIKPPEGVSRVEASTGTFGEWLRRIPLKKDNTVYLYNGKLKENQAAQFAVLDIPVGKKDLQQCADAVMRIRADYLFAQQRFREIEFRDNNDKAYSWKGGNDSRGFDRYLENVFGWCGSASLEKQLRPVPDIMNIQSGDVFIRGGYPGHAMIVVDVATNPDGRKIFMLAQSYMPAQDIHIVQNPANKKFSPWYEITDVKFIITPECQFTKHQLRRW